MDKEQLRKEWFEFSDIEGYGKGLPVHGSEETCDWWLQKIQGREKSLLKEIDGIRKTITIEYDVFGNGEYVEGSREKNKETEIYNKAIDDIISLISSKI